MLEKLSSASISGLRWMVGGPMEDGPGGGDGFEDELDVEPQRETVQAWADRIQADFTRSGECTDVFHGLKEGASTRRLLDEVVEACGSRPAEGQETAASMGYMFGMALHLAVERTAATRMMEPADVVKEVAIRLRRRDDLMVPNQFVLAMYKGANDLV